MISIAVYGDPSLTRTYILASLAALWARLTNFCFQTSCERENFSHKASAA